MARSRVVELAEEEAARAEAEEPDDDAGDDEPGAGGGELSDEELAELEAETEGDFEPLSAEAQAKALEAAIRNYQTDLRRALGPDFDAMETCPLCTGLGATAPDTILLDPDTVRCDKCHGHGAFLTESFVEGHLLRQCPRCMGNGYIDKPVEYVAPPPIPPPMGAPAPSAPAIPPMPYFDPQANIWRDPQGNALVSGTA